MSNSTDKFRIEEITKDDGSQWIDVVFLKYGHLLPRFRPSFHDLHRIIRAIGHCEDAKYPPPTAQGRFKFADFLYEAGLVADFNALAAKYQIPERDGDLIVKTNGARIRKL